MLTFDFLKILLTPAGFTPFWRCVGSPIEPSSFVFFIVAHFTGHHRPLAVISHIGTPEPDDTLRGTPLLAACDRLVTIFSNKANHQLIQAEIAIAATYYIRTPNSTVIELPYIQEPFKTWTPSLRQRPWDRGRVQEFPFVAACLLQGVGFDPLEGTTHQAHFEPLSTVYRDTCAHWEWCFSCAPMKWAASEQEIKVQRTTAGGNFALESGGEYRVAEQSHPRTVLSAEEYMVKNRAGTALIESHAEVTQLLAQIPLVELSALDCIWPVESKEKAGRAIGRNQDESVG
ncbi:hypothetical protein VTL71DRAFT_10401 [Oculimacula yallundae]|uniref:Uncharacterized protein n=1 Tax=Oculimacula yallundae TaxID=86028 RepID=A0ABR4CTF8_9HELO